MPTVDRLALWTLSAVCPRWPPDAAVADLAASLSEPLSEDSESCRRRAGGLCRAADFLPPPPPPPPPPPGRRDGFGRSETSDSEPESELPHTALDLRTRSQSQP